MGETGERREAGIVVALWHVVPSHMKLPRTYISRYSPAYLPRRLTIMPSVCFSQRDEVCLDLFDRE